MEGGSRGFVCGEVLLSWLMGGDGYVCEIDGRAEAEEGRCMISLGGEEKSQTNFYASHSQWMGGRSYIHPQFIYHHPTKPSSDCFEGHTVIPTFNLDVHPAVATAVDRVANRLISKNTVTEISCYVRRANSTFSQHLGKRPPTTSHQREWNIDG